MRKVVFVGMGRVGTAMAVALKGVGYEVLAVDDLDRSACDRAVEMLGAVKMGLDQDTVDQADAVFITTNDDSIGAVARGLSERFRWPGETVFAHTSGSQVSAVLGDRPRLSIHPLQSFANVEEAVGRISRSVFSLEGDEMGIGFGERVALDLGVKAVRIDPEQKPLYHLAACVACNYVITLIHEAKSLMVQLGFSQELAEKGLLSLLSGTVANMERLGVEKAITGPIMRGDLETVQGHLEALKGNTELKRLYALLGAHTARMALGNSACARGREDRVKEIEELLSNALYK